MNRMNRMIMKSDYEYVGILLIVCGLMMAIGLLGYLIVAGHSIYVNGMFFWFSLVPTIILGILIIGLTFDHDAGEKNVQTVRSDCIKWGLKFIGLAIVSSALFVFLTNDYFRALIVLVYSLMYREKAILSDKYQRILI